MKKLRRKLEQGFTFMEVMVGMLIINIGVISMLTGAVHAHNILRSTELKERAFEEIRMELERWRGRVIDGRILTRERAGDPRGKKVYLEGDESSSKPITAIITYEPIVKVPDNANIERYEIEVKIEWEDFTTLGSNRSREMTMSVVMSEFDL